MLCHFLGSTLCLCVPSRGFISESLAPTLGEGMASEWDPDSCVAVSTV